MFLEPFSGGYYIGEAEVVGFSGKGAAVATDEYEYLREQIFSRYEAFGLPVIAKFGSAHVELHPESGIPRDTLAVGENVRDIFDSRLPQRREVLVANEPSTRLLLDWDDFLEERSR